MKLALVITMSAGLSACATTASLTSEPPGAKIYLNEQYLGTTPAKAKLNDGFIDGTNYYVKLVKAGYKTQSVGLAQHYSGGYIAMDALLLLPTFGLTGYLCALNCKVHASHYHFLLEPVDENAPAAAPPPAPSLSRRDTQDED